MVFASPEPNMPKAVTSGPPINSLRRPLRSANIPAGTLVNSRASPKAVTVAPTRAVDTPKLSAYSGRIGLTMP